jgi:xanthine dehydrogenase YagR molybdenum-binding subunit
VEGTFAIETAVDMLAARLGIDPLKLRRMNIPREDPVQKMPYTRPVFRKLLDLGEKRIRSWPKLVRSQGDVRRGRGMAAGIWGVGGGPPASAAVHVLADGTIQVFAGTQDLGTGTKTVLAQVAAEEFGIPIEMVAVTLGDTSVCPYGPASWGSMTVASVAPAVRLAANDARDQIDSLWVQVFGKGNARKPPTAENIHELGQAIGPFTVIGKGSRFPNPAGRRVVAFAAQFAQVAVDVVTGEIRVEKALCVHDCGRVLNPKLAQSQVEGGFIQGMGFALMEGRRIDPASHRVLNPSLLEYKVPTVRDIPEIETIFLGGADTKANNTGAIGLGEPPVIPAAAAIGNAVFDAIGVRLTRTPFTPKSVLEGLAATGGREDPSLIGHRR